MTQLPIIPRCGSTIEATMWVGRLSDMRRSGGGGVGAVARPAAVSIRASGLAARGLLLPRADAVFFRVVVTCLGTGGTLPEGYAVFKAGGVPSVAPPSRFTNG